MLAFGLVQDGKTLKCALIDKKKGSISIESLKEVRSSEDVKLLYTSKRETPILATALDCWDVLFRKVTIPIRSKQKALSALPFQLESILPFPLNESIVIAILKQCSKNATSALLFAAKETALQDHLNWAQSLEIDPDLVSTTPIALYRLAKFLFPKEPNCALFYSGELKSFILSIVDHEIFLTHTIHSHEDIRKELDRFAVFFNQKNSKASETKWLLLGPLNPSLFSETVSNLFLPTDNLPIPLPDLQKYALSIGLSLNALAQDDHVVQFREGKFAPIHLIKKRKKHLISYCALSLSLILITAIGSHLLIGKKELLIKEQLKMHLPMALANEPIEEILFKWEKGFSSQKNTFPLLPNIPSVSDILSWASSHPSLTLPDGSAKEGIEIKSIRYHLYKHPKLGDHSSAYQARVEMEFTSTIPRLAREFHDALLAGDSIVNNKLNIQWSAEQNIYFTSFELKGRNDPIYKN